MRIAAAGMLLLAWNATAWAEAADPAAEEAADANLESVEPRRGMVFTFGVGGGFTFGLGVNDSTGTGGAGVLRVGRVANRRAIVGLEITGMAHLARLNVGPVMTPDVVTYRRDTTALLVFGQYYFGPVFWLRAGVGVARYAGEELRSEVDVLLRERIRLAGLAGSAGAGVDLIRLKRFRAGVEIMSTGVLTRDGVLSSNALMLDLTFD